jgi:membrane associated rhomboid family serine protease
LIIINVVTFLVIGVISVICEWTDLTAFSELLYRQFTIPPTLAEYLARPWTLITYMIAHDL